MASGYPGAQQYIQVKVRDTGVALMWQYPPGIRRSQRYEGGVHCSQKTKQTETEAPISPPMVSQMATLCHVLVTSRSRKSPRDHLATAMPTTAKVWPMAS